jgi:hypothetical protein
MNSSEEVISAIDKYEKLEKKFADFAEAMKNIPVDNGYKVIAENFKKNNFNLVSCNRKINVIFNSFGTTGSKYLGKVSFEIPVSENENKEIFAVYFDDLGNNYFDLDGSCNPWTFTDKSFLEKLLIEVISAFLNEMAFTKSS